MHLFVALQLTGGGESQLTAFVSALVRGQQRVLFTHVRLKLLVFLELQAAAFNFANVFLLLLGVDAAHVPGTV